MRFVDVIDEAIERGGRRGRREEPGPAGGAARSTVGHADRHRRPEVRRPVDRPGPGLRVRLGADAVVRRQHGAVPAVRPRPDLLDLPAGRTSSGPTVRATVPVLDAAAGAGSWRCACSASAPPSPRRSSARARTGCATYLYELASDFTAFYEHCPVLKAPDASTRASRLALSDVTARVLARGLQLLGIDAPEQM